MKLMHTAVCTSLLGNHFFGGSAKFHVLTNHHAPSMYQKLKRIWEDLRFRLGFQYRRMYCVSDFFVRRDGFLESERLRHVFKMFSRNWQRGLTMVMCKDWRDQLAPKQKIIQVSRPLKISSNLYSCSFVEKTKLGLVGKLWELKLHLVVEGILIII